MQDPRLAIEDVESQPVSEEAEPRSTRQTLRPAGALHNLPTALVRQSMGNMSEMANGAFESGAAAHNARRAPSVSVRVLRDDLRGAIGYSNSQSREPYYGSPLSASSLRSHYYHSNKLLSKLRGLKQWKKVLVEGTPMGTKDSVFFAPDEFLSTPLSHDGRSTPTSFVNIDPTASPYTVHRGDAFEISFLGVSVSQRRVVGNLSGGSGLSTKTCLPELLLYSLASPTDPLVPGGLQNGVEYSPSLASTSTVSAPGTAPMATTTNAAAAADKPESESQQQTLQSSTMAAAATGIPPLFGSPHSIPPHLTPNGMAHPFYFQHQGSVSYHMGTGGMQPRALSASGVRNLPSFQRHQHGYGLASQRALSMSGMNQVPSTPQMLGGVVPTGLSTVVGDMPFIHYDPVIDGHDGGNTPDAYIPIPATKALYLRSLGKKEKDAQNVNSMRIGRDGIPITTGSGSGSSSTSSTCYSDEDLPQSVSIRFTIMEIDKVSDVQARAISGVDHLGNYVSTGTESVPYLELLTRAFAVASSMGKGGLRKYEKPDHVHSVDMEFLLAEKDEETGRTAEQSGPKVGNYLQYGYYFFLSDKVDAKLYAQTCSSSQSIPLLLKREGFTKKMEARNEKEFFPLTGISYLVAKVSRGCKHAENDYIPSLRMEHKRRLDNMVQMSHVIDMLATMHSSVQVTSRRSHRR